MGAEGAAAHGHGQDGAVGVVPPLAALLLVGLLGHGSAHLHGDVVVAEVASAEAKVELWQRSEVTLQKVDLVDLQKNTIVICTVVYNTFAFHPKRRDRGFVECLKAGELICTERTDVSSPGRNVRLI